jgi:hypothetical protein
MGFQCEFTYEKVIIWLGNKMMELNRDMPIPLAAPPRFASDGMFLPITENALMAETNIVSYLRAHAPHMLNVHAAHALLEVPNYSSGFKREYADQIYLDTNSFNPPASADDKEDDEEDGKSS